MQINKFVFTLSAFLLLSASCYHETGSVDINFSQTIDSKSINFNELIYTNTAGNLYQINEIKYFISKMTFIDARGKAIEITQDEGIHYVDCSIEKTLHWKIEGIPYGKYVGVSFVFGLDQNDNISNRFVNPPESNFSWPNHLGGGYHYMQINGKFLNKEEKIQNLNIHTGIGQIYNENNEITQFIHNHFTVMLPINLYIDADKILCILPINMEIQRWFDTPNLFNFNDFGFGIMQNQHAQELLKGNAGNVFN